MPHPSHFIIFHFILPVIFSEIYKLRNSSLCNFLQAPVNFSFIFYVPYFNLKGNLIGFI